MGLHTVCWASDWLNLTTVYRVTDCCTTWLTVIVKAFYLINIFCHSFVMEWVLIREFLFLFSINSHPPHLYFFKLWSERQFWLLAYYQFWTFILPCGDQNWSPHNFLVLFIFFSFVRGQGALDTKKKWEGASGWESWESWVGSIK